jgi:hypothetical protein
LNLFPVADFGDDFVEHRAQVLLGRLRKIDDGDFLVQFRRNFHHRRNQHDGFEAVFQMQGDVLELADDGEIVFGQERMKILEEKIAGSTCSITWSSAASGSLVEALRFFCDWMEVPAGTMPLL